MADIFRREMNSANKIWKDSGSTLPFAEWLTRQKAMGRFVPNLKAQQDFKNLTGSDTSGTEQPIDYTMQNILRTLVLVAAGVGIYKLWKKGH